MPSNFPKASPIGMVSGTQLASFSTISFALFSAVASRLFRVFFDMPWMEVHCDLQI